MTHVDILTVTCPTNKSPHEYIQQYDGTLNGLKAEIEKACLEIGLDVSAADINTYGILKAKSLVIFESALKQFESKNA